MRFKIPRAKLSVFHFSIISICDVYSFHSKGDSAQLNIHVHAPHPSTMLIVDMKLRGKHFVFVLFCCFFGQFPMEKYHLPLKLNLSYLISVFCISASVTWN